MVGSFACEQATAPTTLEVQPQAQPQPLEAWINSSTSSRFIPDYALRIPDPQQDDDMRNWTGSVYRGMSAKVTATQGEWRKVVYSQDATGWMLASELISQAKATQATTLRELKTYAEADFGQLNETLRIPAGTLLFILEQVDELSFVNYDGEKAAWVESALLSTDPSELKVSELIYKAKFLEEVLNGPNARVLDKARIKYPKAKLIDTLANHVSFKEFNLNPIMPTSDVAIEGTPTQKK